MSLTWLLSHLRSENDKPQSLLFLSKIISQPEGLARVNRIPNQPRLEELVKELNFTCPLYINEKEKAAQRGKRTSLMRKIHVPSDIAIKKMNRIISTSLEIEYEKHINSAPIVVNNTVLSLINMPKMGLPGTTSWKETICSHVEDLAGQITKRSRNGKIVRSRRSDSKKGKNILSLPADVVPETQLPAASFAPNKQY